MTKPLAWSYSLLTAFETCPRRFYFTRVAKTVVEPQTEATIHGNAVHKSLELAVRDGVPLPEKYLQYQGIVNKVLSAPGQKLAEQKWGLTRSLAPCGFFDADVWVRGVLDCSIVRDHSSIELDWKTGKPKSDIDQLELFAAAAFALRPRVETVRTGYVWLAHNKLDTATFRRADATAIWEKFIPRVSRVQLAAATGEYPPRPSGLCKKWCPVPRSKCEFAGGA